MVQTPPTRPRLHVPDPCLPANEQQRVPPLAEQERRRSREQLLKLVLAGECRSAEGDQLTLTLDEQGQLHAAIVELWRGVETQPRRSSSRWRRTSPLLQGS